MREESLYLRKSMDIQLAGNIFSITIDILIILRADLLNIPQIRRSKSARDI